MLSLVIAALVGVIAPESPSAPSGAAQVAVVPLQGHDKADGRSFAELTQAWWRWAYRQRDGMRPTQDPTGAQCHVGQEGAVWFLAGTGGTGPVDRKCTVPEGRYLFLPVLAVLETSVPGRRRDCSALRADALERVGQAVTYRVELDGTLLTPVRSASRDCFDAYADAEHNDPPPGSHAPASTDGLWLLLPPLTPGRHRLVVEARQATSGEAGGRIAQQFTYVLHVGAAPADENHDSPLPDDEEDFITL